MYVPKSALVTLVTLSCDVVPLSVTRLASTGLPSRNQEKVKVVVPTQSLPVQVSVRGSPTVRSGSVGVTPTEGGAGQQGGAAVDDRGERGRAKEGRRIGACRCKNSWQHFKHTVSNVEIAHVHLLGLC